MKLSEVTKGLAGVLVRDAEFEGLNFCTESPDYRFLTFMEKEKFINRINKNASCILCTPAVKERIPTTIEGVYVTNNPKYDFYRIHNKLATLRKREKTHIDKSAHVSKMATIAEENVVIGRNVVIEANVVINENVFIEDDVIIHSNCVIGGRSFDFAKSCDGEVVGWIDSGRVVVKRGVEICSSTHIAQACLDGDVTFLDENCKIDALVYLAHGVHIGKRTLIAGGAVIGGNSFIGDDSWVGLNATVSNRIKVGNGARISLGSVVTKDVGDNTTVTGNFAIEHSLFIDNLKKSLS